MNDPQDHVVIDSETGDVDLASDLRCVNCSSRMIDAHKPDCPSRLVPLETDEASGLKGILEFRAYQGGTRPLLVHRGSFGDTIHSADGGADCPCQPIRFPPLLS